MSPRFSIIIPHKNSVDLLERCLFSIPNRDDIEVIVVDDNSTLSSDEHNKLKSLNNSQTQVIFTKEGRGAGYARNVGLDHAKGEWVLFADADDYFYTENLNALLSCNIPNEYMVVVYGAKYISLDGSCTWYGDYNSSKENSTLIEKKEYIPILYRNLVTPWIKMIRMSHIKKNNIRFEEVPFSNDEMFSTQVALTVANYGHVNLIVYHHEKNAHGLMSSFNTDGFLIRWNVYLRKEVYLRKHTRGIPEISLLNYEFFLSHPIDLLLCALKIGMKMGWKKALRDCKAFSIYHKSKSPNS